MTTASEVNEQLRLWAVGIYATEAATDLLIKALGGTFATLGRPWIYSDPHGTWIDFASIPDHLGVLSGGEQRLLRIAASLGCSEVFINLADDLSGLDAHTQQLVLAAITHATRGSHDKSAEHCSDSPPRAAATASHVE